ncbi:MAG: hypothetical protein ACREMH_05670 [Gemmatimonadales bacterium]
MDELWLILVFFYLGATLFGRAMKKARGRTDDAAAAYDARLEEQRAEREARRQAARTRPQVIVSAPPGAADLGTRGTQGEARTLEALFRGMGIEVELPEGEPAAHRRAPLPRPPLPEPEDPEEARSLEGQSVEGEGLDVEPKRAERAVVVADAGAEALVRQRIEAAEARSHGLSAADHAEFHRRIAAASPTEQRRVAIPLSEVRRAMVWREVLGPPLGLRDPEGPTP